MITHDELRPLVLRELMLIFDAPTEWVERKGSAGAAERNYLLALGLIKQGVNDHWMITFEGRRVAVAAKVDA